MVRSVNIIDGQHCTESYALLCIIKSIWNFATAKPGLPFLKNETAVSLIYLVRSMLTNGKPNALENGVGN